MVKHIAVVLTVLSVGLVVLLFRLHVVSAQSVAPGQDGTYTSTSNCVVTEIGNPTGPSPTLPPECNVCTQGSSNTSSNLQIPKHGVTSVYSAADLDQLSKYGFQYVLPYYSGVGEKPTDTNSAYGQALQRNNIKIIVDVTNYGPPNSPPWLYNCGSNGKIVPDLNFLTRMVNNNKDSPQTLGYWIKDDDYHICTDNTMSDAMKQVYQKIKQLDPNPNHYVFAGFGGAYSIKANYQPGVTDVIGYYAYQAWNRSDYVCNKAGNDQQIMQCEIDQLNSIVKSRTPAGVPLPAWIDMYQAYYTNTMEPYDPNGLKSDIQASIAGGASSLIAFAWDKASGVDHVIKNDSGLQSEVQKVNTELVPSITGGTSAGAGQSLLPVHGAFTVHSVADVDQAAGLGIQYIIPYWWGVSSQDIFNPNSTFGAELTKKNMKAFLDVSDFYVCKNNTPTISDTNALKSRVDSVLKSPLLLGYWIKDDDIPQDPANPLGPKCGSGMADVVSQVNTLIKNEEKANKVTSHPTMAGFDSMGTIQRSYRPGMADIMALYPYRAYNDFDTYKSCLNSDKAAEFNCEVSAMSQAIKEPFVGIYQAFYGHNNVDGKYYPFEPPNQLVNQDALSLINAKAIGLIAFGWRAKDVDKLAYNDAGIQNEISQINALTQSLSGQATTTTPAVCSNTGQPNTCGGNGIIWLNSASDGEFPTHRDWIGSQCSQASMAEILNAYGGRSATITYPGKTSNSGYYTTEEVLTLAQQLGVWNVKAGFLGPFQQNWQAEGNFFGFNVQWNQIPNPGPNDLDKVIAIANQGTPLIVGAPGHYLVLWGGDSQNVWTLDSSGNNLTWAPASTNDSVTINGDPTSRTNITYHGKLGSQPLSRAQFLHGAAGFANYWDGTYILITPKNGTNGVTCQAGNNDLVKAAEAIKKAYDTCENGFTKAGSDSCIDNSLKGSGYTDTAISAFDQVRAVTLGGGIDCTECLGFVAESLGLAEATAKVPTWAQAKDVLNAHSFQVGSSTYVQTTSPQPGDIGIANGNVNNGGDIIGSAGHALIVYKLNGNVKFTAIESNWGTPSCKVSDTVDYHLVEDFTYYRKQ